MKISYIIFAWVTCIISSITAYAVPAHPGWRIVENPDGSVVELRLLGDEFGHITIDRAGRILEQDSVGNWKVSDDKSSTPKRLKGRRIQSSRDINRSTFPRIGNPRTLVVLVDFPDINFVTPDIRREIDEMLNLPGFDRREHIGCAADYFRTQSLGLFSPQFDVYGPVRADKATTWYGENDANGDDMRASDLAIEICNKLDSEIDFSDYDLDGDGQIDNLYFFYAGYGENFAGNKASWIWPHAAHIDELGIPEASRTFDGKVLNSYGCCAELYGSTGADVAAIGTFCHEFGHIIGLPDTYDVNYSDDGSGNHPDEWDIMASGSYLPATRNCGAVPAGYTAVERWLLGWEEPIEISLPQNVELSSLQSTGRSVRISTSNPDEFFILENRQQKGYDRYIPSHGLLVWHVDRRQDAKINVTIQGSVYTITCADAWELDYNALNCNATHQCLEIEKASGNDGSKSTQDTPFPGRQMRTSFTDDTNPSMRSWSGAATGRPVTAITEQSGVIRFDYMGGGETPVVESLEISNIKDDGFLVTWDDNPLAQSGYVVTLYEVSRTFDSDAITIDQTFAALPEEWSVDGTVDYTGGKATLGGSKTTRLTTPVLDLTKGATLTIRASQSGTSACTLKIYADEMLIEEYVPSASSSNYTIQVEPTTAETLAFEVDRRKNVSIERITLKQDVEIEDTRKVKSVEVVANRYMFSGLANGKEYACRVTAKGFATENGNTVFATIGDSSGLDGIDGLDINDFNFDITSNALYFNMQGIRVDKPAKGNIYIVVRNGKSQKLRY